MSRGSWIVVLVLSLAGRAHALMDITTCGQTVPHGEIAMLQVDLDCGGAGYCVGKDGIPCTTGVECAPDYPGCSPTAVFMERGAQLYLNGHTIAQPQGTGAGISCNTPAGGQCRVFGPGTVSGGFVGVSADYRLRLEGLTLTGARGGWCAIVSPKRGKLYVTDVVATDCEIGLHGTTKATNVTVSNAVHDGIEGAVKGRNLTVTGCLGGITEHSLRGSIRLVDSTLSGNSFYDINADHRPRLRNTTCDHSLGWGVCTFD